ncbi:hypothetical protein SH1V18_22470 [Vallitalea longa]|uniref:Uncharacterized protein n=1 Tax=Vallitalea longa TaxID=2936439 RepID=A0A9W5Y9I4_9FIRM|nr:DUF2935 domain-containing protein [Vallitalea longa]GKX29767.1 hypothetical protein SH1V18_22470 [Vallitalea longa]
MDMFDCGIYSFVNAVTIETVRYWARNSYQHIDVLINSAKPNNGVVYESFNNDLKRLYKSFHNIYDELADVKRDTNVYFMVKRFLIANDHFMVILQRLKFEGFNGYPELYQVTYHILYEQMYVKEIFRPLMITSDVNTDNVVINSNFRRMGLGTNPIQCIYGQIYFWSIIGAEHPSIIMNISPNETKQLPKKIINEFNNITKKFNDVNYKLSNIYPKLNNMNILVVIKEFSKINEEFIRLLYSLKDNIESLPNIKNNLPKLFFAILEHIINEHGYAKLLTEKILESQYGKNI